MAAMTIWLREVAWCQQCQRVCERKCSAISDLFIVKLENELSFCKLYISQFLKSKKFKLFEREYNELFKNLI